MRPRKPPAAARAALLNAVARGLLKPHGGHFAVKHRGRQRIYPRRFVERVLAEQAQQRQTAEPGGS